MALSVLCKFIGWFKNSTSHCYMQYCVLTIDCVVRRFHCLSMTVESSVHQQMNTTGLHKAINIIQTQQMAWPWRSSKLWPEPEQHCRSVPVKFRKDCTTLNPISQLLKFHMICWWDVLPLIHSTSHLTMPHDHPPTRRTPPGQPGPTWGRPGYVVICWWQRTLASCTPATVYPR